MNSSKRSFSGAIVWNDPIVEARLTYTKDSSKYAEGKTVVDTDLQFVLDTVFSKLFYSATMFEVRICSLLVSMLSADFCRNGTICGTSVT